MAGSNFSIDFQFEIHELHIMGNTNDGLRVKDLHDTLGVSKGHASEILRGKAEPGQQLALRIFRHFGVKLGPIAHATDSEINALEKMRARGNA